MIPLKKMHRDAVADHHGVIPYFLNVEDPRPAAEQFDANYGHGGGWRPMSKWLMKPDGVINYPGDPDLPVLFEGQLRDETIRIYDCGWVSITQPDGSFEVSRMD